MSSSHRYAPVERQIVNGEHRYVRLADEPMHLRECLPWLLEHGFVVDRGTDPEGDRILAGWGSTYFMVPFEKSVGR